jgi:hypothetical protein
LLIIYGSCPQELLVMSKSEAAKVRAEATFKRKEEQIRMGAQAWAEYEAAARAVAEKTKRLRALRLARDAGLTKAAKQLSRLTKPRS